MEKNTKGGGETPVVVASLTRRAWMNIVLLILAVLFVAFGIYLNFQPEWVKGADIKLYNKGVSAYLLPPELLPATDDRPSEYPIMRAAVYFQQAASESNNDKLKSLALYNLGTLMGEDVLASVSGHIPSFGIADAIDKLGEAVILNPDNEDAKYNLELLKIIQAAIIEKAEWVPNEMQRTFFSVEAKSGYSSNVVDKGY